MIKNDGGLYDQQFEHDNCGIGAVVNINGTPSHQTVEDALQIVENLDHRAGKDAEGKTGDGVGILLQISHRFFSKIADTLGISLGGPREYGVGMFFFPQQEHQRRQAMKMFQKLGNYGESELYKKWCKKSLPGAREQYRREVYQTGIQMKEHAKSALDYEEAITEFLKIKREYKDIPEQVAECKRLKQKAVRMEKNKEIIKY